MSADNLKELLIEELKDIYDAEHRLTKALPKLAKAASSDKLVAAFENHLAETEEHVQRLEEVFTIMGETPKRKTCKAMVGLVAEGQEIIDEDIPVNLHDLALIAAAQKVEHYEIATYGCLRTWAELLGEARVVKTLQMNLDEEGAADKALTEIAMDIDAEVVEEEDEAEMVGSSTGQAARKPRGRAPSRSKR